MSTGAAASVNPDLYSHCEECHRRFVKPSENRLCFLCQGDEDAQAAMDLDMED